MSIDLTDSLILSQVLEALGANNTEIIKEAEKTLKPFTKQVQCIPCFLEQIEHSDNVSVRHMASLILKKKINSLFSKCEANDQAVVKQKLLSLVTSEPVKPVRSAIAGIISSLAKNVFSVDGDWPEVFTLLTELLQHTEAAMRALCFNLICQLSEHITDHLLPHTHTIAEMICSGFADSDSTVAVASLGALTAYMDAISDDPSVMVLQSTLSPMLEVMHKCIESGDEEVVAEGLDVIQECALMDSPILNDHIEHVVPFAVEVMKTIDYEVATRNAAGQAVLNIVENRPKLLAKKGMVEPVLGALVEMLASTDSSGTGTLFSMAEMQPQEEDDDDDDDYTPEMETQEIAQMCLDKMAFSITSRTFIGPALRICADCMSSNDGKTRKAGCGMLGIIVEGCSDALKPLLSEILPRLCEATTDPEYFVRECACFALGQFSEHCQPDILHHHQQILPVVFNSLQDARPTVQSTSCYVLENFCENLEPSTLVPFLPSLMERLVALLSSPQRSTQEMALAAISAAAVASEIHFLDFTQGTVEMLEPLIFITEPHLLDVRGRALECLGHIAVAVGSEHFEQYFNLGLRSAVEGTKVEGSLCEYSYTYIANTAKVMGSAYKEHLETLVPHLLDVIREGELTALADEDDVLGDDSEDDDENSEGNFHLNVEEGFINSKKAALSAIGSLAEHCGADFYPFLENTINTVIAENVGVVYSFHRIIRAEAYMILQHLLKVAVMTRGPTQPPGKGEVIPIDAIVTEVSHVAMTSYLTAMVEDVEMLPSSYAIEGLMGVLELIGVAALQLCDKVTDVSYGEVLVENISLILKEQSASQQMRGGDVDEDDEDGDHDNLVMDATCDLISGMAKVIGEGFVQFFEHFSGPLLKYTKPSRSYSDRAMVIGCYAEVMKEIGPSAAHYADAILPIVQVGLTDSMEAVRRNSAYCVGALAEIVPAEQLEAHIPQLLQWLHPLCIRDTDEVMTDMGGADVDNALSSVARMMNKCISAIPLQHVLPVLLAAMPLRSDYDEAIYIYEVLARLIQENEPNTLSMMPQILIVFAQAISEDSKYQDEVKALVISCLKFMSTSQQHQEVIQSALEQLSEQPAVTELIQSAISH